MKGKHKIIVTNRVLHYEFEIKRNITIIQGDSATGKTTLIDMLRQYMNVGIDSGIDVVCDVPCTVLEGRNWKLNLSVVSENIVFIDEGNGFIKTEEFANSIKNSDNYFVLVTRENLYNLPYSVDEIYGIHSSGKYQNTKRIYQELYHIYSRDNVVPIKPHKIILEDSNSGYEFFKEICNSKKIDCISAGGKSNINSLLKQDDSMDICIIADGAAIGSEMANLYKKVLENDKINLYLPESFEWIILKSGIIKDSDITKILESPEEYIDSNKYFSWERFFTYLLMEKTNGTYLQYTKKHINEAYLNEKIRRRIIESITGVDFN